MPSQEDYLDNLLKGIENTEEEENSRKESEEGVKDETLQDPQIDMSDMDDLLQSALEAQQRDIPETQQSQNTQNSETIHPEETSSMSEDEIDRLLQQSCLLYTSPSPRDCCSRAGSRQAAQNNRRNRIRTRMTI